MAGIQGTVAQVRGSGVLGQLIRFGIVGAASTAIYAAVYLPLVWWVLPAGYAFAAVPPAFLVAAAFGFVAHGSWSFRGHGTRGGRRQQARFLFVQGAGMVLNALFTLALVDLGGLAAWVPLVPAMLVTPVVTFALNRQWVFG